MRSPKQESITVPAPPDAVFQAALGVAQNSKNVRILAVHNEGRKLVLREKAKLSNPKFQQIYVDGSAQRAQLKVVVGSDPRTPKAMMDGRANEKSLKKLVESVQGALDGSAPAPATPVANHYVAKKAEIPWENPAEDPQIELDGNFLALYGV